MAVPLVIRGFPAALYFLILLSSASSNFTLQLIHRDSPQSPLYNPGDSISSRLTAAYRRSISRSRHFKSATSLFSSKTDLQSALVAGGGEYLMKIAIGTPPSEILAIADTGSDLTWIQCSPCKQCYKQTSPIFDRNKSSTYKTEPCNSRACRALAITERQCDQSGDVCKYRYLYGDNSFTKGDVALESVSIDSSSGSPVSFPATIFGCGYENGGTFDESGAGIIGLGGGPLSLISQIGSKIGKKFSYCLSHTSSTTNGTSVINLGANSMHSRSGNDSGVVSTPLVDKEPETYYYLTLEAVTVGKKRLVYTGPSYELDDGISTAGNLIIDSGTTLTLLDAGFYDQLGEAVEAAVTGAERESDPQGLFVHCFKARDGEIGLPEITVNFKNADVRLRSSNAFVRVNEDLVCLSLIPTNDVAIYGNLAQVDFLVGYDLESRTVSFLRTACSGNL